jgi:acid stress-induced BolA-like protein IbaG/YrbA
MNLEDQIRIAVEETVPNSTVEVSGSGGHFNLKVISPEFAGKKTLEKQRMVYGALKKLMAGSHAPVHAIDSLETLAPENGKITGLKS